MTLEGLGLVSSYGPTRALSGVDVSARGGEIVAVVGPNGAGKTTLLRVLSGERRPERGSVLVDGSRVRGSDARWRARVGLVSHSTGLYRKLSALENLRFFAMLQGVRAGRGALLGALDSVGAAGVAAVRVEALSQGQRQRVALARTLLHDPEILFLDEPFTGLDAGGAAALERELRRCRAAGRIVLLVTHDVARIPELADRTVVLRRGRKVYDGAPDGGVLVLRRFLATGQAAGAS